MSEAQQAYDDLMAISREVSLLGSVSSVLHWDQQTMMPSKAAGLRGGQLALLARMMHERFISPQVAELLAQVEQSQLVIDPESDAAVNIREIRWAYDRKIKLSSSLVEEMARTHSLAQQAWIDARKKNDFPLFRPWLEKVLHLARQEAKCLQERPQTLYDALLEGYEPGETAEHLNGIFQTLRPALVELVGEIIQSGRPAPLEILERSYPREGQEKLAREAAAKVGFDFSAGRLDISAHPFCSGPGPGDTRMTTRYDERYFADAFFGVLHETGHGLYDQGLPQAHFGTPRGQAVSLGIHESQSRLWENFVGRSRPFWRFFLPRAKEVFGSTLADVDEPQWYRAVNDIRPSLIRTESDEATYNLHILLRFELEQALLEEQLDVQDLPAVWKGKMKEYLGVDVPDDARGCLQDIHWSGGSIGYFPTYTLGNLYAAMFYEKVQQDIRGLEEGFSRGDFAPLLAWLREQIHRHGKTYRSRELVRKVTGQEPSPDALLRHLRKKAKDVYGVG